jgi:S-adenosylmethionine hydrolase
MKGVIARYCPDAHVIDISHAVAPQNIQQGAYRLWTAFRYFPASTVFVAVVDPGVGTARRPIAVQTGHGIFVGPDNGLFSAVLDPTLRGTPLVRAVALHSMAVMSNTFHGRDLFAPVGAALACGQPLSDLGTEIGEITRFDVLKAEQTKPGVVRGEIVDIDRFGNLITSLGPCEAMGDSSDPRLRLLTSHNGNERVHAATFDPRQTLVQIGDRVIKGIQVTYGSTPSGALLALINSADMIEIAVNGGNAAEQLAAAMGDRVQATFWENVISFVD